MSSTRLAILASASQSATAQSSAIAVGNLKELAVCVQATVVTGSLHALWMQGSSDGGTTWFDILAESIVNLTSGSVSGTTGTWIRNIITGAMTTGQVMKAYGTYKTFGDYVRAAWVITAAANPTVTLQIDGVGKN
jgi:hypothetical protein